MRFTPTWLHGTMDFALAGLLLVLPWCLGHQVDGAHAWIPVMLGVAVVCYSAATKYEYGLIPLIHMRMHLALDAAVGALLAASPWIFQFQNMVWIPHLLFGVLMIGMAQMTEIVPGDLPTPGTRPRTRAG